MRNVSPAGPTNAVLQNATYMSYNNSISCTFANNQSFYCVVCCSTDPSVPPDSSVYNISTTKSTKVTVSLQGLTSGQLYYCKAAATSNNSAYCAGPVVGGVKMYFSFVPSLLPVTTPITCRCIVHSCKLFHALHLVHAKSNLLDVILMMQKQ